MADRVKITVGETISVDPRSGVDSFRVLAAMEHGHPRQRDLFAMVVLDCGLIGDASRYWVGWTAGGRVYGPDLHTFGDLRQAMASANERWLEGLTIAERIAARRAAAA